MMRRNQKIRLARRLLIGGEEEGGEDRGAEGGAGEGLEGGEGGGDELFWLVCFLFLGEGGACLGLTVEERIFKVTAEVEWLSVTCGDQKRTIIAGQYFGSRGRSSFSKVQGKGNEKIYTT